MKATWLKAIKAGFYDISWLGLTYSNASKYFPAAVPTTKGHITKMRQGVRSTKPKGIVIKQQPEDEEPEPDEMEPPDNDSGNNLIVKVIHQSNLYTNDTWRFLVASGASN